LVLEFVRKENESRAGDVWQLTGARFNRNSMDDSIPNIPTTLSDDESVLASSAAIGKSVDDDQTAYLTLVQQLQEDRKKAEAHYQSIFGNLNQTIIPPDYFKNLIPDTSRLHEALNVALDFSEQVGRINQVFEDVGRHVAEQVSAINAVLGKQVSDAMSESLKSYSLRWLNEQNESFKFASGRIIDASAVIRVHQALVVTPPPATIHAGSILGGAIIGQGIVQPANVYEETGTATTSLHASGEDQFIGVDGASLPPINGWLNVTQGGDTLIASATVSAFDSGTLTETASVTKTYASTPKPSVNDAWLLWLAPSLQAPAKMILNRFAAHRRGIPLPGLHRCEYSLQPVSLECMVITADGNSIGSVTYANGILIVRFYPIVLTYRPDLIKSDCLEVWGDIEQHLALAYRALIAEVRTPVMPAPAQADQLPAPVSLPTDPNDSRLIESGMIEKHRFIVAMTNKGKTPVQIADMNRDWDAIYVNNALRDIRNHPQRAQLVKPAKPKPRKSKTDD
jgi:hypothetical protein